MADVAERHHPVACQLGSRGVVPLGLALATDPDRAGTHPRTFLLARWLVPAGAMTAVASG